MKVNVHFCFDVYCGNVPLTRTEDPVGDGDDASYWLGQDGAWY